MKQITIALAGNPNAGKTSLFNQLTGARAHVGNYPGVTVEIREGFFTHGDLEIRLVDLPGTYSLTAYSMEELAARDFIINSRPDLVVDVVDASNLERNLYLGLQFMEMGVPMVIALNMMDVAESRGLEIDLNRLSELLGAPVAPTVARSRKGLDGLLEAVARVAEAPGEWTPRKVRYGPDLDEKVDEIVALLSQGRFETGDSPLRWLAVKILEGDAEVLKILDGDPIIGRRIKEAVGEVTRHLKKTLDDSPEGVIADHRYGFINSVTRQAVNTVKDLRQTVSDKVDLIVLNRLLGPIILLAVLYVVYQFVFVLSEAPVEWLGWLFGWLSGTLREILPPGPLNSMITSGIIDGVGGVLGFVPLIAFMFFAIALLEDSGYMARIAFIMDRVLRTFGLHGSSVLALMVGGGISGGCAVPGVMAARTLRDPKERLATILVTPYMNCGAKLPVFAILIGAFFSAHWALMMFLLTLIAWTLALIAARILRWTILKGRQTPFVMELPPYRPPTLKGLLIHTWERIWQYIKKAGTVILAVSILIWALMTYPAPPENLIQVFDHQRETILHGLLKGPAGEVFKDESGLNEFHKWWAMAGPEPEADAFTDLDSKTEYLAKTALLIREGRSVPPELARFEPAAKAYLEARDSLKTLEAAETQSTLKYSAAGRLGILLEKLTKPLGFDWRTNIALVGGIAAKEVIISTLSTAYSLGESAIDEETPLSRKLAAEPGFNRRTAFILMLFIMMYSPCFVTLVAIGREAGWRWSLFSLTYTTVTAYLICLAATLAARLLGLGA